MVGGHEFDHLAPEYSRAVERAAVQQHLRETQIVSCRRDGAAAATGELVRLRAIAHVLRLTCQRIARKAFGEAVRAFGWNDETGVAHPERSEDALAEERRKRLS